MINCPTCIQNPTGEKCEYFGHPLGMAICPYGKERPPKNHFEQIKQMTMEEMAKWFGTHACCMVDPFSCSKPGGSCKACWLKWLMEGIDHES